MPEVELILTGFNVHTDQGRMGYCTVSLIRGEQNILVDTGHHGRRQLLLQSLKDLGFSPDEIDLVVLTHLHWDHSQNIDLFKNATIAVHKDELAYAQNPAPSDWATSGYVLDTLKHHEVLEVEEGQELAEGVRVLGTPGHSKGHISVTVETSQGTVVLTGDALTAASCIELGKPLLVFWNEEQAAQSVQKILGAAKIFYPGHDRPFKVDEKGNVEYIGGDKELCIFQGLGFGNGEVSVTISPEPPRNTVVSR